LLAGRSPKPAAAEVFRALTERVQPKGKAKAKEVSQTFALSDGKKGVIRAGKGGAVTVELPRGVLSQQRWPAFEEALRKLLSELPEAP
jgi:ParB family chromosome partitioning protein